MKAIFSGLLERMNSGKDAVLATLVAHAGSVPRGMGSQMLLDDQGIVTGTVGGGVGEMQMTAFGLELLKKKACAAHTYELSGVSGDRLGSVCGGAITVYFHYIAAGDDAWRKLAEQLLERIEKRQGGWMIQRFHGAPALLDEEKQAVCGQCPEDAAALCRPFDVQTKACFAMPLHVGERAVLFGAGHCAQALAPILASVGFRVTVYDDRPVLARRELFPQAERIICAPYEQIGEHLKLEAEDYIVAMTSTHISDLTVQSHVLQADHIYVGMLGSKNKREYIFDKLLERGVPQEMIDRVHTPVGLAIKAVTPAEIAISVAGEMVLERALVRERAMEI